MRDKFFIPEEYKLSRRDFDLLVEDQVKQIKKTLASKGDEYSPGQDDALHNFNVGMLMTQASGKARSREEVIWGMAMKHHISIMDMVLFDVDARPETITIEKINEKFGDMINYLILMKASIMQTIKISEQALPFAKDSQSVLYMDVIVRDKSRPGDGDRYGRLMNYSSGPMFHPSERDRPISFVDLPANFTIHPKSSLRIPEWYAELVERYPDNAKLI